MPEKHNFFLRMKARLALKGQWQTALLVMLLVTLPSMITQIVSMIRGGELQVVLLDALRTLSPEQIADPAFLKTLLDTQITENRLLPNLLSLAAFLLSPVLLLGSYHYFQQLLRGNPSLGWSAAFSRMPSFFKGLGLNLLVGLKCLLWGLPGLAGSALLLLLSHNIPSLSGYGASWIVTLSIVCYIGTLVPMIRAMFSYALSLYFLADHPDWKLRQCLDASKTAMAKQKLNLFTMELTFFVWQLAISYLSSLVLMLLGDVVYYVVSLGLSLALNVYRTCSLCAFYDAWRDPTRREEIPQKPPEEIDHLN